MVSQIFLLYSCCCLYEEIRVLVVSYVFAVGCFVYITSNVGQLVTRKSAQISAIANSRKVKLF